MQNTALEQHKEKQFEENWGELTYGIQAYKQAC